jgi:hypothetical protein
MTTVIRAEKERVNYMGTTVIRSFKAFGSLFQKAGPYLLLESLLPGGTLFALLLFLYQRRQQLSPTDAARVSVVVEQAIDRLRDEIVSIAQPHGIASLWRGRHRERDGLEALAMAPTV